MKKIQLTKLDGTTFDDFVIGSMPEIIIGLDGRPLIVLVVLTLTGSITFPNTPQNSAALGITELVASMEAEIIKMTSLSGRSFLNRLQQMTGQIGR